MSYRTLANRTIGYTTNLRDSYIDQQGVHTKIRRPDKENPVNFYGDFTGSYLPSDDITVLPLYDKYYQVIDILGTDVELNLPLEVLVKVNDFIPNSSVIRLAVRNQAGGVESRWWTCLSTMVKHLERYYARVAKLAPCRTPIPVYAEISINVTQTMILAPDVPSISVPDNVYVSSDERIPYVTEDGSQYYVFIPDSGIPDSGIPDNVYVSSDGDTPYITEDGSGYYVFGA